MINSIMSIVSREVHIISDWYLLLNIGQQEGTELFHLKSHVNKGTAQSFALESGSHHTHFMTEELGQDTRLHEHFKRPSRYLFISKYIYK